MKKFGICFLICISALLAACGNSESHVQNADGSIGVRLNDKSVTISEAGRYVISGSLKNGSVIVDADKDSKLELVLDGVEIHSKNSAAIYIKQADKVTISLAQGSENRLSNGGKFEKLDDNNIDAVLFSKEDLKIKGAGSLIIDSPAGHGIVSKDSLEIKGGSYNISAMGHGIDCNEDISIENAKLAIACGKDGIRSENSGDSGLSDIFVQSGSFEIKSEGDGISAGDEICIKSGEFNIVSGGGAENAPEKSSQMPMGFPGGFKGRSEFGGFEEQNADEDSVSGKAIKAGGDILFEGGIFALDCADDAVHSNGSIKIDAGDFKITSGDDGFHADESLMVSGGNIEVLKSYEGLEALHIEILEGNININADDDGLNAAGGTDQSGFGGRGKDRFGPPGMSMNSDGSIVISGGKLYVKAGGDGIDANGTLEITGGDTVVCTPTYGDTATLDFDVSGIISGGSFLGSGANNMMAQTFDKSLQGIIAVGVGSLPAGTEIKVYDSLGNLLIIHSPELEFAVAILSTKELEKGQSYTITVGELSGEIQAY